MIDTTIMLVEDDPLLRETLSRILKRKVGKIELFESPIDALKAFDSLKPDIVITDIKMPVMTGLEMIEEIRKKDDEVAVIITSAFSEKEHFLKAIDLKVQRFLVKPIDVNKLIDTIREIAEKEEVKHLLKEKDTLLEQYKHIVDLNSNISITDAKGNITYVNDKFCQISKFTEEELIGQPHSIIRHPDMPAKFFKNLWDKIQSKEIWQGTIKNRAKDGTTFFVETTIAPLLNAQNEIVEYISIKNNVTDLITSKQALQKQLVTDSLTKLPNRLSIQKDIAALENFTLMIIDIDRFKEINFLFGHNFGDAVLINMAQTISQISSEMGMNVYRISADEFVLLKEGDAREQMQHLSEQLRYYIESEPFEYEDISFDIDFTSGIVLSDSKMLNPIEYAEAALRVAKVKHKNIYVCTFESDIQNEFKKNFEWTKKVKEALKDDRITVYYQPIYDIENNQIAKYECLVRLIDEDGQAITPYYFLESAKRSKLYREITKTVITKACETFATRSETVSINFSIEDLMDKETLDFLIEKVKRNHLEKRIYVEVLESEGVENFELIRDTFKYLKSYGISIAIDDFGSGYSNFSYLINLDIYLLKIDGSLIKDIAHNNGSYALVELVTMFAHKLGIKCVGEFVSDKKIYETAQKIGIDYAQGYYLSQPLPSPLAEGTILPNA